MMIISSTKNNIPVELYSLIWWILVGSEEELQTEVDYLSDPPPPFPFVQSGRFSGLRTPKLSRYT